MKDRSRLKFILPIALILLGVALLCNNLGIVPGLWSFIIGLWPIALIALGLVVLFGWQKGWRLPWQEVRAAPFNEPLGSIRSATLDLSGRTAGLVVEATSATSQDLLGGKIPETSQVQVETAGQAAVVHFKHQAALAGLPFIGSKDGWQLRLHPGVAWTLHVAGDVGEAEMDLADLRVQELRLDGQLGEVKVRLPGRGQCVVWAGGQVDELTLRVPDGVAARIHQPAGPVAITKVDTARFPLRGDAYETPGFESAADWVEIRLDGGVGNLRIA